MPIKHEGKRNFSDINSHVGSEWGRIVNTDAVGKVETTQPSWKCPHGVMCRYQDNAGWSSLCSVCANIPQYTFAEKETLND